MNSIDLFQKIISQAVTEAIYEVHGSKFKYGSISELVGK